MKIVSWVIFVGLCIKAGAILISYLVSVISENGAANNLYLGLDLSQLKEFSQLHYAYYISFLVTISAMKAYLFYLVIRIFSKINLDHPFNEGIGNLIKSMSYYSFSIGLIAAIANRYSKWLVNKGVLVDLNWGSSEFLFLGGILLIISLVFKRGLELQEENELTI